MRNVLWSFGLKLCLSLLLFVLLLQLFIRYERSRTVKTRSTI